MSTTIPCSVCGSLYEEDDLIELDGSMICCECLDQETAVCEHCGQRILLSDAAGDADTILCQHCYEEHYTPCECCGRVIYMDDAYYEDDETLCLSCYEAIQQHKGIQNYYYKPEPLFYGEGPRYFGVELELDEGGESSENANCLLEIANECGDERAYCKHDGSLDEGFEIVSHPMSLDYHLEEMPWPEVLQSARRMGYLSHQAGTCGLHVHVSRKAFGDSEEEQDTCIARILYFVEKNWEELLKFSRRTSRQLERWAARYGYKEQPREILEHAKTGYHGGRYTCVNLENHATIEFRMFRGTLKQNTFIATLQMVNRLCDVALFLSDQEVKAMSWTTFVSGCQEPELVQYLKERRLYVNEPVNGEEEV